MWRWSAPGKKSAVVLAWIIHGLAGSVRCDRFEKSSRQGILASARGFVGLRNQSMSAPTPTTPCLPGLQLEFNRRRVELSFDGPDTSSDGGLLLLRRVDDALGLTARIATHVSDKRAPGMVIHSRHEQIRQRVFGIALGYEDQNDATTLRQDPLLRAACGREPTQGPGLSSQPSLSRLEHAVTGRDVVKLQRALEADYVASLPADTAVVVLDMDATDVETHGQQPLSFFHGHYDHQMYFPLLVVDGDGRIVSVRLRAGNAGNFRYALAQLVRIVRAIKARFPGAQVAVRADAGFCAPRLLDALEDLNTELGDIEYVIGIQRNSRLVSSLETELALAAETSRAMQPARVFSAFTYAAKGWRRQRHIVAKAEHLGDKPNPRFVVTTLDEFPPRFLYENGYCGRGNAENRIKDFKTALAGDRLSCTTYIANAFRLLLHAFAYRLMDALRDHLKPIAPALGRAQFDTIRLRLLKVAAHVRGSVRRIAVMLPRSFPLADVFSRLCLALGARTVAPPTLAIAAPLAAARRAHPVVVATHLIR